MSFDQLPHEEQARVAAQVEYFLSVVLKRYGMNEADLSDAMVALREMREHKEFYGRIKAGGTLSVIGLLLAALGSAVWQGIKILLTGGR
jgi:hypothetical protein